MGMSEFAAARRRAELRLASRHTRVEYFPLQVCVYVKKEIMRLCPIAHCEIQLLLLHYKRRLFACSMQTVFHSAFL
jgi:hypothetical protein